MIINNTFFCENFSSRSARPTSSPHKRTSRASPSFHLPLRWTFFIQMATNGDGDWTSAVMQQLAELINTQIDKNGEARRADDGDGEPNVLITMKLVFQQDTVFGVKSPVKGGIPPQPTRGKSQPTAKTKFQAAYAERKAQEKKGGQKIFKSKEEIQESDILQTANI